MACFIAGPDFRKRLENSTAASGNQNLVGIGSHPADGASAVAGRPGSLNLRLEVGPQAALS